MEPQPNTVDRRIGDRLINEQSILLGLYWTTLHEHASVFLCEGPAERGGRERREIVCVCVLSWEIDSCGCAVKNCLRERRGWRKGGRLYKRMY